MAHQYSRGFEKIGRFCARHAVAVVLVWLGAAAAVNIAWPQLEAVANQYSVSPMPSPELSPALAAMQDMATSFGQPGMENSIVVVMQNDNGFDSDAQARYRALAQRLKDDHQHITFVQDLLDDPRTNIMPAARNRVMSADGKVWMLVAGVRGDIGSPDAARSFRYAENIVDQTFSGSTVKARITGMAGLMGDMTSIGIKELPIVGGVTVVLMGLILFMVFRSPFTALLPLMVMGVTLAVARGVVAGLANWQLIPISTVSSGLMMAVLMGASVNYTVFMVGRYHERLRAGEPPADALAHACGSMSRVILAAAATVAIANAAQLTARLTFLSAVGPSTCIAVAFAFLVATTLLPAVLTLAAKRNLAMAGPDRTRRLWHRAGVIVTSRTAAVFATSLVLLSALAASVALIRPSFDMMSSLPADAPSAEGMKLLSKSFSADAAMPQFVLVKSGNDMRTPAGLADLDNVAAHIAQLPGVTKVLGITRPDGNKLTQATLAWQMGFMGSQMDRMRGKFESELQPQLDQMVKIGDVVSAMARDLNLNPQQLMRLQQSANQAMTTAQQMQDQLNRYQSLIDSMQRSPQVLDQLAAAGPSLDAMFDAAYRALDMAAPTREALNASQICSDTPECVQLREQLNILTRLRNERLPGQLDNLRSLLTSIGGNGAPATVSTTAQLNQIRSALGQLPGFIHQYQVMNGYMRQLQALGIGPNGIGMMRDIGPRIREMNQQMQDSMSAMTQAAAFLQTISKDAGGPTASGFYFPAAAIQNPDFQSAASIFLGDNGRIALYMVQSDYDPYGPEAMALSRQVAAAANAALPNTTLSDGAVSVGGFPAINADLQDAFNKDFAEIIVVALLIVFVVMCLLLRSIVAPIYLLLTVVLTYVSALGLGVLVFQEILHQQIQWAIPAMTFIMIVAVGADYNMLFISRLREESTRNMRLGIIRTVAATGSVITSAGLIFASALMGMMAGSIPQMQQMGFIIGVGILLDTFIVRTLMVPALAKAFGKLSWWPSRTA